MAIVAKVMPRASAQHMVKSVRNVARKTNLPQYAEPGQETLEEVLSTGCWNNPAVRMRMSTCPEKEKSRRVSESDKYPNQVFAQLEIEGKMVKFQLDLGATCNVIRYQDLLSGVRLQKTNQVLSVYNKDRIHPMGRCLVNMMNPKTQKKYKGQFVVVENKYASLLGAKTIQQMGLVKVCHEPIMMTNARDNPTHQSSGESSKPDTNCKTQPPHPGARSLGW